jgi:HlyD family secretion protein
MNGYWNIIRRWAWRGLRLVFLLLVVGTAVYWFRFAPLAVDAHPVQRGTIVGEVMGTGTLEARVSTTVSPKISGRIAQVLTDQGEVVEKGMLLVQLDDEELRQQVEIAQANVDAALAAIVRLNADKERSTAVFEQAQRHHARIQRLVKQSATTEDELERATEALAVAVSDVSRAEAAIAEGQKGLVAAEKTLEYHRARLADTRIMAPFDGLIVARQREAGDVVVPGSSILTLISTDLLWIRAWVDETEMSRLAESQSARVVFRSEPERAYPGRVLRLGREADRETREFVIDVQVLELPANWAVGQRAEVFIETARHKDVVQIPTQLLLRSEEGEGVFINEEGQARWRPLQLGLRSRDAVEVVEGLSVADTVIIPRERTAPLSEGRRVQVP